MSSPLLKKRFGQHHLVRPELCEPLIRFLEPQGATVIEVGPGGRILTRELERQASKVIALELDPEWAFGSCESGSDAKTALAVVDAMDVAWGHVGPGTLIAGNLPYEIASALIRKLLPLHASVPRMSFLVQREVAERFLAGPGSKVYGLLAILAAAWSDVAYLGNVARGSFRPPPKVEGAFLGFTLKPPPLPDSEMPDFVRMIELAFSQRRKTLRNALASGWGRERADSVLEAVGVARNTRAEELGLEPFLALYEVSR